MASVRDTGDDPGTYGPGLPASYADPAADRERHDFDQQYGHLHQGAGKAGRRSGIYGDQCRKSAGEYDGLLGGSH